MKKNIILTTILTFFVAFGLFAQGEKSGAERILIQPKYMGTFVPTPVDGDLLPLIEKLKDNNKGEDDEALKKYKKYWSEIKHAQSPTPPGSNKTAGTIDPIKVIGFDGLDNQGTPSDNTIAISKAGDIIAAVNSRLRIYSTTGPVSGQSNINLSSFFNSVAPNGSSLCDPLVQYDPDFDRFIVFAQTCDADPATSSLLLGFSVTNDPAGAYHYYQIDGNLKKWRSSYPGDVWFDYPKMAVSQNDIFISGNMFNINSQFIESALYQIDKTKCFAGSTLGNSDAVVWNNFTSNPFTLVPANYGRDGNYGDKMYVMTSRAGNSYITMFEVTGRVQNSTLSAPNYLSVPQINQPANGVQSGGSAIDLNTGDARGMSAIVIDNVIHYVFHSGGPGGYVAINYSRVYVGPNGWKADNQLLSIPNVDCAFPAIASAGWNDQDHSTIITFNYSSLSSYPGVKAFYMSDGWQLSNPLEIKTGTNYVNFLASQGVTRWGDYSGIARDHSASVPTVWTFGMAGNNSKRWDNYIAKISTVTFPTGVDAATKSERTEPKIYPNPVRDFWNLALNFEQGGNLKVDLIDITGKKVKDVHSEYVSAGKHAFSFNKGALSAGSYFVRISLNNKIISNEKITVSK